jgi:DNA-binding transcriptional regulator YdaS (Cro superfamily)
MWLLTPALGVSKISRMSPKQAIDHFGSQAKLARALGVKQPSVFAWVAEGEIPLPRQYQIELATAGVLRADLPANRESA